MQQFLADLRADELDPAQLDAGVGRLERGHDGFALRGGRLAFLQGRRIITSREVPKFCTWKSL